MRNKLFLLAFCMLFLASCSSSRTTSTKKRNQSKANETQIKKLPSVNQSQHVKKLEKGNKPLNKYTLQYIKKYASLAVLEMHKYKIPASITLAQGVLELSLIHISEPTRRRGISYAVFCLKKKTD